MNLQEQAAKYAASISKNDTYREYLDAAFIAGAKAATVWLPIETVPKDGDKILVCIQGTEYAADLVWWDEEANQWVKHVRNNGARIFTSIPPTHWMPCPEPLS